MAFKKLNGCDGSDMSIWAGSIPARHFKAEISALKEAALRKLIKSPTEESAAVVRAWEKVESLFEEAHRMG